MTDAPKPTLTEAEQVEQLAAVLHPDAFDSRARNAAGYAARWFNDAAKLAKRQAMRAIAAGWVSPEEANAREAAARREALLEAERAMWGPDAEDDATYARLSALPRERTPFYILTVRALAEPERDEEGR